jgi:hypothetical protein
MRAAEQLHSFGFGCCPNKYFVFCCGLRQVHAQGLDAALRPQFDSGASFWAIAC